MPDTVHEDQTGFVKGRYIGYNIRKTEECIQCLTSNNKTNSINRLWEGFWQYWMGNYLQNLKLLQFWIKIHKLHKNNILKHFNINNPSWPPVWPLLSWKRGEARLPIITLPLYYNSGTFSFKHKIKWEY